MSTTILDLYTPKQIYRLVKQLADYGSEHFADRETLALLYYFAGALAHNIAEEREYVVEIYGGDASADGEFKIFLGKSDKAFKIAAGLKAKLNLKDLQAQYARLFEIFIIFAAHDKTPDQKLAELKLCLKDPKRIPWAGETVQSYIEHKRERPTEKDRDVVVQADGGDKAKPGNENNSGNAVTPLCSALKKPKVQLDKHGVPKQRQTSTPEERKAKPHIGWEKPRSSRR